MGKLLRVLRPPLPHPVSVGAACRSARGGGCGGAGQHPSLFTSHPALITTAEEVWRVDSETELNYLIKDAVRAGDCLLVLSLFVAHCCFWSTVPLQVILVGT